LPELSRKSDTTVAIRYALSRWDALVRYIEMERWKSLCPVDIPTPPGMPTVIALLVSNSDPVSRPVAILGLLARSLFALYVSTAQVRRMEINYTTE
jgi:hypothetical protein